MINKNFLILQRKSTSLLENGTLRKIFLMNSYSFSKENKNRYLIISNQQRNISFQSCKCHHQCLNIASNHGRMITHLNHLNHLNPLNHVDSIIITNGPNKLNHSRTFSTFQKVFRAIDKGSLDKGSQDKNTDSLNDSKTNTLYFTYLSFTFDKISSKIEEMIDDETIFDLRDPDPSVIEIETSEGIFVLSRQRANEELWYSSPLSGPWHYKLYSTQSPSGELILEWKCTREGEKPFWERFTEEISQLKNEQVDFGDVLRI